MAKKNTPVLGVKTEDVTIKKQDKSDKKTEKQKQKEKEEAKKKKEQEKQRKLQIQAEAAASEAANAAFQAKSKTSSDKAKTLKSSTTEYIGTIRNSGDLDVVHSVPYDVEKYKNPASLLKSRPARIAISSTTPVNKPGSTHYPGENNGFTIDGKKTWKIPAVGDLQDTQSDKWATVFKDLHDSVYIPDPTTYTRASKFYQMTRYYDRFKIPDPNLPLQRGFPHVFFTRPSCNILTGDGSLTPILQGNDLFTYLYGANIDILYQLSANGGGYSNDFMFSLSNMASSFSNTDEMIDSNTFTPTYTGYKVSYGKNDINSKTSGNFSIEYVDSRNQDVYYITRAWVQYISGVYRGEIFPKSENIIDKILDYTSAVYYILTAEDGESIIFWTKYYGVYPSTIPSSHLSWGRGNVLTFSDFSIEYQYSWKEDCNPYTFTEFNHNARMETDKATYVPIYDPNRNGTGDNWVGTPYVVLDNKTNTYKLRFQKMAKIGQSQ